MEKIRTLLIDTEEFCENFKKTLKNNIRIDVVGETNSGRRAVEIAEAVNPDVVVLDVILPEIDGFEVIEKIRVSNPELKIIITSSLNSTMFVQKAMNLGVEYFMVKPVDPAILAKRIAELFLRKDDKKKTAENARIMDEKITNIFLTVGIPAHIKGYYFLREAIKMAVSEPNIINSITKKLYPSIAGIYETSSSKVERAIRHAIEVAWNKGKIENINDVFGLRVYDSHEKPTNGEFIALVADKMLLEK